MQIMSVVVMLVGCALIISGLYGIERGALEKDNKIAISCCIIAIISGLCTITCSVPIFYLLEKGLILSRTFP